MLRFLLRFLALACLAVAVFLVLMQPKETVAGVNVIAKVNVSVQCSSVWDQVTHKAKPASLTLNGNAISSLPAAQNACDSASRKIKKISAGLAAGAVVLTGLSFVRRRSRRPRGAHVAH
ncbi:MAG TPA: hypothetical protein VHV57_02780 [Acidimicrobiales bacterium]|jgi:hypothetical protein|nr:hypothetical protein [Acidimicrobiales bacterium]